MGKPHSRRLVRRNMPFGPELSRGAGRRGRARHRRLLLCGDLETQWEFIQRVWVNEDIAARHPRHAQPIGGAQPDGGGSFTIPSVASPGRSCCAASTPSTRGSILLPGIGLPPGFATDPTGDTMSATTELRHQLPPAVAG
jgi:deferrochelatase/peroxidase EfeB